ncbi:MAG: histidinol dehydrogenase [Treponemataceae bacterium]|nr:histidinol dehydrogenase [Treponemataceae bacterium]
MEPIQIISAKDLAQSFFTSERLASTAETSDVSSKVAAIIADVRAKKDAAIKEYSSKFDRATPDVLEIPREELEKAKEELKTQNSKLYESLCRSHELALAFALRQKDSFDNFEMEIAPGLFTGQKTIPIERAGVYVPAGRFPLLSTVVMCITPAKAAGCKEIVLCTPPREHPANPKAPYADKGIMAAAAICGADHVYACGGAQAIAAMAYGTESIPACDVIVGPGNKFVAEAKRKVYGQCGIDMVAGPTEVFIIADDSANPAWVAADMLAQAEHDVDAQAVLATPSKKLAEKVAAELEKQLDKLATEQTARESLLRHGKIIITETLKEAADIANKKAPEHLELALDAGKERDELAEYVHNYGSLFIGHESAEVLGDYSAGLNHTLPTSMSARYTGGLSVRHFLKTVTTLRTQDAKASGYKQSLEAAAVLGDTEGLAGHAQAARIRQ